MTAGKQRRWPRAIASGLLTFVLIVAAGLAGALVVVPRVFGGMSLTVLSGSMEPGIMPGDIVVTKGVDVESAASLQVGDVITFLPYPDNPMLVTHRIIAKTTGANGTSFITQGDNNNCEDPWGPVQAFQVRGAMLYSVPKVGWVRQWVGDRVQWVVIGLGVGLIAFGVVAFGTSWRKKPTEPDDETPINQTITPARRALPSQ